MTKAVLRAQFMLSGKGWGLIDETGDIVVPARYDEIHPFREGLARVSNAKGKYGFIDAMGREVIPVELAGASDFCDGLAAAKVGRKWGYLDRTGALVIEPRFQEANEFSEGLALVDVKDQTHGYIDRSGAFVIEPSKKLYSAGAFSEGLARVAAFGGKARFIDRTGAFAFEAAFEDAGDFKDGRAPVILKKKCGLIDRTGALVIEAKYGYVDPRAPEGLHLFCEREGVADTSSATVRSSRWGYLDRGGRVVHKATFDSASPFSEGVAVVGDGESYGFVLPSGKPAMTQRFHEAYDFVGGLAAVAIEENLSGAIDREGVMRIVAVKRRLQGFELIETGTATGARTTAVAATRTATRTATEPEPIGQVTSVNSGLLMVIADALHARKWKGINGKDCDRAVVACEGGGFGARLDVGDGDGCVVDLGGGNGAADVFRASDGRIVLIEGATADADPTYTTWAVNAPKKALETIAEVESTSGWLVVTPWTDGCSDVATKVKKASPSDGAMRCGSNDAGILLAVPPGRYEVVVEKQTTRGGWGQARRCHLIPITRGTR